MDGIALIALTMCAIMNRPSRQWITISILAVFTAHYLLSNHLLESQSVQDFMSNDMGYGRFWAWPYYITAAMFDAALALFLVAFFKKSSLRKDILLIIILIIAVDAVGFIAYIDGASGDYHAGAMAAVNAVLIWRLLVLTRRDKDGLHNLRCSDFLLYIANTGDRASGSEGQAR